MGTRMTHAVRGELANAIRRRYGSATGKEKRRILEEFVAATGYHEKSAIRVLNRQPALKYRQIRQRPSLYDEAARGALIVLWEASDRVCGKRLKALLPILLPALERNGHLKLDETIRPKVLAMSAATIDRLLRMPRSATRSKKPRRVVPAPQRRIRMRTFADWHEPPPGSMEMDLVAHCGDVNRGSYVHSLVLHGYRQRMDRGGSARGPREQPRGRDARAPSRQLALCPASTGRRQRQRICKRQADRILPKSRNRAYSLAPVPQK